MIRRSPLLLAFAVLFGGCTGLFAPQTAELGQPFWLGYHEAVILPTSAGTIRFAELIEDSRCPSEALIVCVWSGRVRLKITTSGFGPAGTAHELRLLDEPRSITLDGLVIELLAVDPQRSDVETPPPSRYRAQLIVTAVR